MKATEVKTGQTFYDYKIVSLEHDRFPNGRSKRVAEVCCIHCSKTKKINLQTILAGEVGCRCRTQKLIKHKPKDPKRYFKGLRDNAIRPDRGGVKEFSITLDDIIDKWEQQDRKCIYSGVPVSFEDGSLSVDRKVNTIGYTLDNIQIVHRTVNYMKNEIDEETFVKFCCQIATSFCF